MTPFLDGNGVRKATTEAREKVKFLAQTKTHEVRFRADNTAFYAPVSD